MAAVERRKLRADKRKVEGQGGPIDDPMNEVLPDERSSRCQPANASSQQRGQHFANPPLFRQAQGEQSVQKLYDPDGHSVLRAWVEFQFGLFRGGNDVQAEPQMTKRSDLASLVFVQAAASQLCALSGVYLISLGLLGLQKPYATGDRSGLGLLEPASRTPSEIEWALLNRLWCTQSLSLSIVLLTAPVAALLSVVARFVAQPSVHEVCLLLSERPSRVCSSRSYPARAGGGFVHVCSTLCERTAEWCGTFHAAVHAFWSTDSAVRFYIFLAFHCSPFDSYVVLCSSRCNLVFSILLACGSTVPASLLFGGDFEQCIRVFVMLRSVTLHCSPLCVLSLVTASLCPPHSCVVSRAAF
jgi:hypothetical protein